MPPKKKKRLTRHDNYTKQMKLDVKTEPRRRGNPMKTENKISPNIVARARPHLFNAGLYLKPYSWINVRKLAKNMNVSPTIAGCVLTTLGWNKTNDSGGSSARHYQR